MRSKKQVRKDYTQSTQELLSVLNDTPEDHFNTKPEDGGWSAGQVAEHLIKSEIGSVRFFTVDTKATERDPEEKIEMLKETFLDFDSKFEAPGLVSPDDKPKDKQKAINKLQDIRQRLTGIIEIEDLTQIVTAIDHPMAGPLTRIEWLYFHIFHSERHRRQIEDLEHRLP